MHGLAREGRVGPGGGGEAANRLIVGYAPTRGRAGKLPAGTAFDPEGTFAPGLPLYEPDYSRTHGPSSF